MQQLFLATRTPSLVTCSGRYPPDISSQLGELFLNNLVSTVNVVYALNFGFAFGDHRTSHGH